MPFFHVAKARLRHTCRSAAVTLGAALLAAQAHAGRPMATDDAAVVEHGACQIELWTERAREPGASSNALWAKPACNPFGHTELALGGGRVRESGERASPVIWHAKHLLRPFSDTQTGFAVAASGERDRRIHAGSAGDLAVAGIASIPLAGTSLLAHLNLGVQRLREDERWKNRAAASGALDWGLAEDTRGSAELMAVAGQRTQWQLGLRHELVPGRLQLDTSVGSPVGRWNERVLTVGLVVFTPSLK